MDDTRLIATFETPDQAEEAAGALDEADIDVELEQTGQPGHDGMPSTDAVGVALHVEPADEEQARDLLGDEYAGSLAPEFDEETDADPFSETDPVEEEEWEEITEGMRCPECHSKDLGLGTTSFQAVVAGVIVAFAAIFLVPDAYINWALAAWGIMLGILVVGLGLRRFPLVCKECGYTGPRHEFDPTTEG